MFVNRLVIVVAAVAFVVIGSASIEGELNAGLAKGMSGDWVTQWAYPQVLGAANSNHLREQARHRLAIAALKAASVPTSMDEEESIPEGDQAILRQVLGEEPTNVNIIAAWAVGGAKSKLAVFVAAIKESIGSESVPTNTGHLSPTFFESIRPTDPVVPAEAKKDQSASSVEDMINSATPIVAEKPANPSRKRKQVSTQWLLLQAEKALTPEISDRTLSLLKDFLVSSEGQVDEVEITHAVRVFLIELLQGRLENAPYLFINGTASMTASHQAVLAGEPNADRTKTAVQYSEVLPDYSGLVNRDLFTSEEVMEGASTLSPLGLMNQLEYGFYHDQRLRPPRVSRPNPSKSADILDGYKHGWVGNFLRWATASIAYLQGADTSSRLIRFDQSEGYRRVMEALGGRSDSDVSEVDVLASLPQLPDYGYALCSSTTNKAPTLPHYTREGYSATEGRPLTTITAIKGVIYPLPFPQAAKGWKNSLNEATRFVDWCDMLASNSADAALILTPLSLVTVGGDSQLDTMDMRFPLLPHERSLLTSLGTTPAPQRQASSVDAHVVRDTKEAMSHHVQWQRVTDGESTMRTKSFLTHAWEQHWRAAALAFGFIAFRVYTGYRYTTKKTQMRQHIYKSSSDLAEEQKK